MKKAALFAKGRVVVADSHLEAYRKLTETEQESPIVSGFLNLETQEFQADRPVDHFYNKQIFLIRHGEAQEPHEPDPPLSDYGLAQVQQLAAFLLTFDIKDYVGLTSPLLRCLQSARIFYEILHLDFRIRPEVMETPCFLSGDHNYRLQNYRDMFPQFSWPTEEDWILTFESGDEFTNRVKAALQDFPPRAIVVTHCGFIFSVAKLALCEQKVREIMHNGIPPASITFIDRQEIKCIGRTSEESE